MLRSSGKETNSEDEKDTSYRSSNRSTKDRRGSDASSSSSMHQSTTKSSKKDLVKELPEDFEPGDFDVVCSRGKWAMNAPGNVRYRAIIKDNLQRYSSTTSKQEKSAIVSEIVESIQDLSPQGGFVRSVDSKWYTVSDHIAREKTGQSFRDLLHTQYRSSTKAKRRRQKEKDLKESQATSVASSSAGQASECSKSASVNLKSGLVKSGGGGNSSSGMTLGPNQRRGIKRDPPAFSLTSASSQVFPNIPNHNNRQLNNNMTIRQLAQQHQQPPHLPMMGTGMFSGNDMAMAQRQLFLQQQTFMHGMSNHLHHSFPVHNNLALAARAHVTSQQQALQEQQRVPIHGGGSSGDLEPIPIREVPIEEGEDAAPLMMEQNQGPLPEIHTSDSSLLNMSQSHGDVIHSAQLASHVQHPIHLHDEGRQQHHPHGLQDSLHGTHEHGLVFSEPNIQHQLHQHPSPQTLRQQLEPLPLRGDDDHHYDHHHPPPVLPEWNGECKGDSFEEMMGGGGFGQQHDDHDI